MSEGDTSASGMTPEKARAYTTVGCGLMGIGCLVLVVGIPLLWIIVGGLSVLGR